MIAMIIIVSSILFLGILYFAYLSRGSQLSIELFKAIFGGVFAAVLIFMVSLSAPVKDIKGKTDIYLLALKNQDKDPNIYSNHLISLESLTLRKFGLNPYAGYLHIATENENFIRKNQESIISFDKNLDYFLDLVEWSMLTWIKKVYHDHWKTKVYWFEGISGGSGKSFVPPNSGKAEKIEVNSLLKNNRFSKGDKVYIFLPINTKGKYIRVSDRLHIVEFDNKYAKFKIRFELGGTESIHATDLAEKIIAEFGTGLGQQVEVTFEMEPKLLYRWSLYTEQQMQWFNELIDFYNKSFSWDILKEKLNKSFGVDSYWPSK